MKQVTQTLKNGEITVNDVPLPALKDKFILVKNSYSVISSGTEKTNIWEKILLIKQELGQIQSRY